MKAAKPIATIRSNGIFFTVLLAVILAVLFGKSFLPGYVHFSNDGPLGTQCLASSQLPDAFTGTWSDMNIFGAIGGAFPPDINALIRWGLGPVGYSKFVAPIALFILGLGAWVFFRQSKLSPLAAMLGALAAALNSTFFSNACWGVASQQIAIGMDFFALALVVSNTPATPLLTRWTRLALAGLAVGINVMEAADIGAIFSVFIATFVFYKTLVDEGGSALTKCTRGIGQVVVIAAFAGFIATQTVVSLVGTQIQGVAGTGQDEESKSQHWNWATSWSEPKTETLGLFVPGLFGYKLDTPNNMMSFLQDSYRGGNYWGTVGSDPALDPYFEGGRKGPTPPGTIRFTSGQNYAGILVALLAFWAIAQSLRRQNSVFTDTQKWLVRFWAVVLIGSLLLAYGRFAPFYRFFYMLPYVSTIRCPSKFLIVFSWAIAILFAYGIHGLSRRYLEVVAANSTSLSAHLKNWWAKVRGFDRNWTYTCGAALVAAVLAWVIYASEKPGLVRYLQTVGFGSEDMANQIAAFSIGQVGWFLVLFALAAGLGVLVIAGIFSGKRARLGGILLGILLVVDLGRANLPYIIHWDYQQKYASNPIIEILRDRPYEHRVALSPSFPVPQPLPFYDNYWAELYHIEWAQHHFLYYNIQSLDIIQMPRPPADIKAFEMAFLFQNTPDTAYLIARRWQLTNTRYLLGPTNFLDDLNGFLDPEQHRFRIVQRFDLLPKPGLQQITQLEEMTAVPANDGALALFEFTGALPRARLYSHWQINTNDTATLQTLASTNFDAWQTVLVSTAVPTAPAANATNENSGTVEYQSYRPKDLVLDTRAGAPTVLLLNDKFDPHWRVFVDGKPAELLRCNFIMRGVYLPTGPHTVEFRLSIANGPLYVSLTAIGVGILLCGILVFAERRNPGPKT